MSLLSLVVPMHNEELVIPAFFSEMGVIAGKLGCPLEFVCVNDGSTDGTLRLLLERLGGGQVMKVVNLSRNFGKEAAMMAGLAQASGDAAVIIDADLQDPPELLLAFLEKWREGYDVVYGVRVSRATDTRLKRWTAQRFYKLFNRLATLPIPEDVGDFRLLDRRAIDAILALPERNRFGKGLFSWVGFHQIGVPFERVARVAGKTSWSYPRLAHLAVDGITSFSIVPLRLASIVGFAVSLLGLLYAGFLVARTIAFGADVPGYASLMVVMLFLGGVQLLCLGVIGEYLGRLYIEAKNRPLYIVSDVYEGGS